MNVTPTQSHGLYFLGGVAPSFTLDKTGPTAYEVRDYLGNVVSSGAASGTTVTPTPPAGGWLCGWFRLYLTGESTDTVFGPAYGSSCFSIIQPDSRFPTPIHAGDDDGYGDDFPLKAALGMGTTRMSIRATNAPTTTPYNIAAAEHAVAYSKDMWSVASGSPYYDAERTERLMMLQFTYRTADAVPVGNMNIYRKDLTIDPSTVTVTATAGTVSGTKVTVNDEVYDNLANTSDAVPALNRSAYVRAFGQGALANVAATVIGTEYSDGIAEVVSTLYPDVTRFEGPSNEPPMNAETAHQMMLFQAAVHAGNAGAKAIGPCPVQMGGMEPFFAAGGGAYCDEISFHCYNAQTNGDLNLGRRQLGNMTALLAKYGLSSVPLWQTEAVGAMCSVNNVYHPRRSRVAIFQVLQWEQFGLPRERNVIWYDTSHGFWEVPVWLQMGDFTVNPFGALLRTLAAETFGMNHATALSFGPIGDKIFLGSLYAGSAGSCLVIAATSHIDGASVTLNVTGATAPLVLVDSWGNAGTVAVTDGLAVLPVGDTPVYLRLPADVTASVATCNDWPLDQSGWVSSAYESGVQVTSGSLPSPSLVVDGRWLSQYTGDAAADGVALGTALPDYVMLQWDTAARMDRLLIWGGGAFQYLSCLVAFTVETSFDGAEWTTQATVTKSTPTSFQFGSDSVGAGCQYETYWDEQSIFDVKLSAPVTAKYVRLTVTATSYGGEPDAQALAAGGQGADPRLSIQEVLVLCDDNTVPRYVTA